MNIQLSTFDTKYIISFQIDKNPWLKLYRNLEVDSKNIVDNKERENCYFIDKGEKHSIYPTLELHYLFKDKLKYKKSLINADKAKVIMKALGLNLL